MSIYSLWLIPGTKPYKKFSKIISKFAKENKGPYFEPHITLIGGISTTKKDAISKTEKLAKIIQPIHIKLGAINYENIPHKALFVEAAKSAELEQVHLKAKEIFEHQDSEYKPHLSLVYGNFPTQQKQQMIAKIGNKFPDEFYIYRLSLYDTSSEDESSWFEVAGMDLKKD